MATIWTRRGCVLSVTFEDRTCDFQTKQHILSVSFALFFSLFWAENRVSKKAVLSRASALSRGARMRDVLSKDRGGIEQRVVLRVLSMLLFARLQTACTSKRRFVRAHRMTPMSRRGFRALFIQTGTREDDETFHAETRAQKRRRNQPYLISGLRSHSRSRERRGR